MKNLSGLYNSSCVSSFEDWAWVTGISREVAEGATRLSLRSKLRRERTHEYKVTPTRAVLALSCISSHWLRYYVRSPFSSRYWSIGRDRRDFAPRTSMDHRDYFHAVRSERKLMSHFVVRQ